MTTSQVATVGHEFLGLPITATRASAAISPMCLFISPIYVDKKDPKGLQTETPVTFYLETRSEREVYAHV